MNALECYLKQILLLFIIVLAIYLPFKIKFSGKYLTFYIFGVLIFSTVYSYIVFDLNFYRVTNLLPFSVKNSIMSLQYGLSAEDFERNRENLISRFKQLGFNQEEILEKIKPLNSRIVDKYKAEIYKRIQKEISFMSDKGGDQSGKMGRFDDLLGNIKIDPSELLDIENMDEMIKELKEKNIYSVDIEMEMNKLKNFIINSESYLQY